MREVNKTVNVTKTVQEAIAIVKEDIISIAEDKANKHIHVKINLVDVSGNIVMSEEYGIDGDDYTLLMSANPDFAPNKPENEYREADLWYIIDLIRGA
ncbi:hypothetical protein SOV_22950 [Sporomusa ovata DSM 2662]|uniref:Phage protein n=1 Tax=Sporomusa ovata TaxID=2378 RepID=A0A0U1L3B9_9FIRM|nr:hypothetical protein [Sporomusa ovata]EQB25611.1 hypothetical protein SOV_4c02740 [Sporomusa ovata DSM 2662]CQR74168.1 Phage protein [Sporomusa ovata]